MSRRALPPTNLLARTRAWFGLDQAAMALYLSVSPSLVHSIEAGRRALTTDLLMALRPLAQLLPPPADAPALPPAPPPGLPAPEAGELALRRRVCAQQAAKVEQELAALADRVRVAARWAQALPALQQAAADAFAAPATAAEAERGTWLAGWLARQARPLPPGASTRWHLLRARLAALAAEEAALAAAAGGAEA